MIWFTDFVLKFEFDLILEKEKEKGMASAILARASPASRSPPGTPILSFLSFLPRGPATQPSNPAAYRFASATARRVPHVSPISARHLPSFSPLSFLAATP